MNQNEELKNLQRAVKDEKLIIGLKNIKTSLLTNEIESVFVSKSFYTKKTDLASLLSMANVKINTTDMTSFELANHCKKAFPVSVVAIKQK
ncbi:MAG: ribosomal L7Ae/L30e/S12e/Gadd45 family protein [DPANN group archaeon]|nr:ribosomal L7Ae/L30e/S12e/Gadd45 family protein [DPANN group archaeon]